MSRFNPANVTPPHRCSTRNLPSPLPPRQSVVAGPAGSPAIVQRQPWEEFAPCRQTCDLPAHAHRGWMVGTFAARTRVRFRRPNAQRSHPRTTTAANVCTKQRAARHPGACRAMGKDVTDGQVETRKGDIWPAKCVMPTQKRHANNPSFPLPIRAAGLIRDRREEGKGAGEGCHPGHAKNISS